MKRTFFGLAGITALLVASTVLAQEPPSTVTMKLVADMPSLTDPSKLDNFAVQLTDAQIDTTLVWRCSAGRTELLFVRHDKECGLQTQSKGLVKNPNTGNWQPRTSWIGKYTVRADGTTEGRSLEIQYTPGDSRLQFGGSMNLKPELTSSGAAGLKDLVLGRLQSGGEVIDERVDTIDLNSFFIPSAGMPSDKGCTWQGNGVFSYQTFSWFWKIGAVCGDQRYDFTGNMPFLGDTDVEGETTYNVVLTLAGDGVQSDDALFAESEDDALFAQVTGITGTITMQNTRVVEIKLDNEPLKTPAHVEATGTLNGTGVPLNVVRSFATLIALTPGTFVGP